MDFTDGGASGGIGVERPLRLVSAETGSAMLDWIALPRHSRWGLGQRLRHQQPIGILSTEYAGICKLNRSRT
jgi:hypothetical protein